MSMIKVLQVERIRSRWLMISLAALALVFASAGPVLSEVTKQTSIYGGTARISDVSDALELGGPGTWPLAQQPDGPYLLSSGSIFIRPDLSSAGSRFEGVTGLGYQRLVLTGGLDGRSTLEIALKPRADIQGEQHGLEAVYDGSLYTSAGSAVYGEVVNCGDGKTCYAGYFSEAANSEDRSVPLVQAVGAVGGVAVSAWNKGDGPAAQFDATVTITGDLKADNNVVESCSDWQTVNIGQTVCGVGQYVAGWKRDSVGGTQRVSSIKCCNL